MLGGALDGGDEAQQLEFVDPVGLDRGDFGLTFGQGAGLIEDDRADAARLAAVAAIPRIAGAPARQ